MIGVGAAQIQSDLPNFPEEVIRDWILPLARFAGWPPTLFSRWDAILLHRPLSSWQSLVWERRRVALTNLTLDAGSLERIQGIIDAGAYGETNVWSQRIRDTEGRFRSALRYMRQHGGNLPRPPVLLQAGILYSVADGHHRLAAYFIAGPSFLGPTCWVGQPRQPKSAA